MSSPEPPDMEDPWRSMEEQQRILQESIAQYFTAIKQYIMLKTKEKRRMDLIGTLKEAGVFKLENVKLKSGVISPIYIDLRGIISIPKILKQVVGEICETIEAKKLDYDIICGVPYAALPLATGVCMERSEPMILRRKEAKAYGTKQLLEGKFTAGQRCLIVEDVVTSGTSIVETADILREHGMIVEHAVVVLDRLQGGSANLAGKGVTLHSIVTMDEILKNLDLSEERQEEIRQALQPQNLLSKPSGDNPTVTKTWKPTSLEERLSVPLLHPKTKSLFEKMIAKQSNLCFSADYETSAEVLKIARSISSEIVLLKLHSDMIRDFSASFVEELKNLAQEKSFLILEDRKFGDTGATVKRQLEGGPFRISDYADLVTAHSVPGPGVLEGLREVCLEKEIGVLIVAEMSSAGSLTATGEYTAKSVSMGTDCRDLVAGFICQRRPHHDAAFLCCTPGVRYGTPGDNLGQQFRTPEKAIEEEHNDILIVGRGISEAEDPLVEARKYREAGWNGYKALLASDN